MITTKEHAQRVAGELRKAGMGAYGASKFASHYLPTIIHPEEHIKGVVYGRYKQGFGLFKLSAGMLIATDRRVIFLDHKPGYTSTDEISYDVVSGIKKASNGLFSTLTLHTRIAEYKIRFVNARGVDKFIRYIESHCLEYPEYAGQIPSNQKPTSQQSVNQQFAPEKPAKAVLKTVEPAALSFLKKHDIGVLSTIDRSANVHGAAVYYFVDKDDRICFVTKSSTQKAQNIFANQQAALTVYDDSKAQTVQLRGFIKVVTDVDFQRAIFAELVKLRSYDGEKRMPPVTTIHKDSYVAFCLTLTEARYTDYKQKD
jgi:hypothetical protein